MKTKNYCILFFSLYCILFFSLILLLGSFPVIHAKKTPPQSKPQIITPQSNPSNYFEFPTETWIISRQDYFSQFLEWSFVPVDGQSGDKLSWNFTWIKKDFYIKYNQITSEILESYKNPIPEIKNNQNDNVWLESQYEELKTLGGFTNKGDFVSDAKRLDVYPVIVEPPMQQYFVGQPVQHIDILNFDSGWFTFSLKSWQHDIYLQIGFGSTITYSGANDKITCTGGSEGSEITFTDVYDEDVSEGWGQVSLQGTIQFQFTCRLQIGDGSTASYFADVGKQVTFVNVANATNDQVITVTNNAFLTLGTVTDATLKTSNNGCSITNIVGSYYDYYVLYGDSTSSINLYTCTFKASYGNAWLRVANNGRIWNTIFSDYVFPRLCIADFYNVQVNHGWVAMWSCDGTFDKFTASNSVNNQVLIYSDVVFPLPTLYNIVISDNTAGKTTFAIYSVHAGETVDIVDAVVDDWTFTWYGVGTTITVYRQYSFNLKVVNDDGDAIENAIVELFDTNDNEMFETTTFANGSITQQTVSYAYYNQSSGDTPYLYSPFTLNVTYPTSDNIPVQTLKGITLDEPTSFLIDPKEEFPDLYGFGLAFAFVISLIFFPVLFILLVALRRRR